ncbi:hypothetical protein ACFQ51_06770 [Streptomyces kaempferi]
MRPTTVRSARLVPSVSSLEEVESAFLTLAAAPWPLTLRPRCSPTRRRER